MGEGVASRPNNFYDYLNVKSQKNFLLTCESTTGFLRRVDFTSAEEELSNVTIRKQKTIMSQSDFTNLFLSVGASLPPYEKSAYSVKGSGIVQNAVAARKPIVYRNGMSMADFLGHGNAVAADADQDFARGLVAIASNGKAF